MEKIIRCPKCKSKSIRKVILTAGDELSLAYRCWDCSDKEGVYYFHIRKIITKKIGQNEVKVFNAIALDYIWNNYGLKKSKIIEKTKMLDNDVIVSLIKLKDINLIEFNTIGWVIK